MRKLRLFGTPVFAVIWILGIMSMAVAGDDRGGNRFRALLTGYEEVPAISTTGTGTVTLDIQGASIVYALTYSALEGPATTASHIHFGQRSVSGGVIASLCGGSRPPCTPTSGSFSGTITAADITGPTGQGIGAGEFAEVVRALRAGLVYANVHSTTWSSGEIRGQLNNRGRGDNERDNNDEDED